MVENLEPNAYALYIACFTEVMGYDLEAEFDCPIKPLNIRRTPLAEFLGVDEGVFEGGDAHRKPFGLRGWDTSTLRLTKRKLGKR